MRYLTSWLNTKSNSRCCFRVKANRADFRDQHLRVLLEQIIALSGLVPGDDPRFFADICLGGGRYGIRLKDWCGAKRPTVDGNDNADDNDPPFVGVARFLQEVVPIRYGILKPLREAPRADADENGMAALVDLEYQVPQARDRIRHGVG